MLSALRTHTPLAVFAAIVLLLAAGVRPLVEAVEDLQLDALFHARARLGAEPPRDGRVKVYVYDAQSLVWNDSPTTTIEQLADVLEMIAERGPASIAINASFSLLYAASPETAKAALARIRALPVPVIVQGTLDRSVPGRSELEENHPSLLESRYRMPGAPPIPALAISEEARPFGPDVAYEGAFPEVASGLILPRSRFATAFQRLDAARVLPSLSFLAVGKPRWDADGLTLRETFVPLRDDGTYLIDFDSRERAVGSLLPALKFDRKRRGTPFRQIQAGDTVLIGFTSYTGGETFVSTPFGKIPGTYYLATLIEQAQSGRWLRHAECNALGALAAVIAAMIVGSRVASFRRFLAALAVLAPILGLVTLAFVFGRTFIPAILPAGAYASVLTAAFLIAQHRRTLADAKARATLAKDLELANQIQDSLAPPATQTLFGRFRVSCHQVKYEALGGDWMAVREGEPGELFLAVGDATGKGVQAALVMHAVQSLWAERLLQTAFDPESFLTSVNLTLIKLGASRSHTATLGIVRLASEGIRYWSAAHVAAVVTSDEGTIKLAARGNVLGLEPELDLVVRDTAWPTSQGEVHILLGSDGVFPSSKSLASGSVRKLLTTLTEDPQRCLKAIDVDDDKTVVVVSVAAG